MSIEPVQLFRDKGQDHTYYMKMALKEAIKAFNKDEVPVGAILIHQDTIIGRGYNQCESLRDPTAHAEMIAITAAANTIENWRLNECILYVTKEPCAMCAGAIVNARIKMVIFGCYDENEGCCGSLYQLCGDPRFKVQVTVKGGVLENDCLGIIQEFFQKKRNKK